MNILSRQLLMKPQVPSVESYEAYMLAYDNSVPGRVVSTSLGTIYDTSKTFAPKDDFISSPLYVLDGDLYRVSTKITTSGEVSAVTGRGSNTSYYAHYIEDGKLMRLTADLGITQIGTDTTWSAVSGYTSTSITGRIRAFGVNSSGLYQINRTDVTQISTITSWDKIVGYGSTNSSDIYGYGISGGKLYYLYANGNGAVQIGTDTTWSNVTGSKETYPGYGLNDGKLYKLDATPVQIGTDTTWTHISGSVRTTDMSIIAINNGSLYSILDTTPTLLDSSSVWKGISGAFNQSTNIGLGYNASGLYVVHDTGLVKILDGNFVYCSGTVGVSGSSYASSFVGIAIRKK